MLYFFYGDRKKSKTALIKATQSLLVKKKDAEFFKFNGENISFEEIEKLAGSSGLFEKKCVVVLSEILASLEEDKVGQVIEWSSKSENVFLWFEENVSSDLFKKIKSKAEKIYEFEKSKKEERNNTLFVLAESVAKKDKKNSWILYHKALQNSFEPEEIAGIIFWQFKSVFLAKKANNPVQAGLKPYVYNKSKKISENFSVQELKNIINSLTLNYHLARKTGGDLEILIEKTILEI